MPNKYLLENITRLLSQPGKNFTLNTNTSLIANIFSCSSLYYSSIAQTTIKNQTLLFSKLIYIYTLNFEKVKFGYIYIYIEISLPRL